ncbi:MAG: hypothetical protein JWP04_3570, partial [Belnapia sp.]|nr:hypothetical protein [Belnapia sp.]
MLEVKQPFAGFNMEVTTTVRYRLIPAAGGDPVFDRQIVAAYSADFSSSFYGVTRLRLANEGAVR